MTDKKKHTRKPLSEAHKLAISRAQKGSKRSAEFAAQRSEDQKAKWANPAHRDKLVEARRRRIKSTD